MRNLILFEDEHLLVVNKPAGMNTHAPSPYAGEGLYDWLKHREPRWAGLSIVHRLDKETSGVLLFTLTAMASRSLTEQFTKRQVMKKYLLLTDRPVSTNTWVAKSSLVRAGDKYVSRSKGEPAETHFRALLTGPGHALVQAEPVTGRTHQIRVHAAESGFPILGDSLYGGTAAHRLCLHAAELSLKHPASGSAARFCAPIDFAADIRRERRETMIDRQATNAYRMIHGAADGFPGFYLDRLNDFLLAQSENALTAEDENFIAALLSQKRWRGAYYKRLRRDVRRATLAEASPQRVRGESAPEQLVIRENGVQFLLRFDEGYSVGIFLDQRDNRRRLLTNHVAAGFTLFLAGPQNAEALNLFAYTCAFSVCAAKAGARTTSVDLSRKYLDWGKRNFALNDLVPSKHDFIHGDAIDWLRRLTKKGRRFDLLILDPPTFSRSKQTGVFQAEKDYGALVSAALPLLKPSGVLFASSNAAKLKPEEFLDQIHRAIRGAKREIVREQYVPQPLDFPITRGEPAYLKTVWIRVQ